MPPANILRSIEADGRTALAVDTGLGRAAFARAALSRLMADPGLVIGTDGNGSEWDTEGTAEIEGRIFVYGRSFSGKSILEIATDDPDAALDAIRKICAYAQKNPDLPLPLPASILVASDGRILLLPEKLIVRALTAAGASEKADGADRWAHPDLSGIEARVFTLAALVYLVFCGSGPYAAATAETAPADIRDGRAVPARLARAGLDQKFARLIDNALGIQDGKKRKSADDKRLRLRAGLDGGEKHFELPNAGNRG